MQIGLGSLAQGLATQSSGAAPTLRPIVLIGGANVAGADDSSGAAMSAALDEDSRIRVLDPATATVADIDAATGFPRPGGVSVTSTSVGIHLAKYLADQGDAQAFVIIPTATETAGISIGGDVQGNGPWDPDAAGPAWAIGGNSAQTAVSGALFLAQAAFKAAFDAAVAAQYAGYTVLPPVFLGSPLTELDISGDWEVLLDKAARCLTGVRAAWAAPSAPWVLTAAPPEWTFANKPEREMIAAINLELSERLPHVAYVEGQEGQQHPQESLHYDNAGLRLLGAKCGPAVQVAAGLTSGASTPIDWVDTLGNVPARLYGLYRGVSGYAGPAFQIDNGTALLDVGFMADGYPDYAAIRAHAGAGSAWVSVVYDQMGSGQTMVPEGAGTALIAIDGELLTQGKRLAWGNDLSNILFHDASYSVQTGGALLAVGRIDNAGNRVMATGAQNTLAVFSRAGSTSFAAGTSDENDLLVALEKEPAWLSVGSGHTLYGMAVLGGVDADAGLYVNGALRDATVGAGFTYGAAGLSWGGRSGATHRYSNGSHVALAVWDVKPSGDDLAHLLEVCQRFARVDHVS
jgi:hypothetical protein